VKEKTKSLAEGVSESTVACLLAMVQGNILTLTVGHLVIATQTGVIAGFIAFAISLLVRLKNSWATPLVLGLCTGVVDYYIHPGSFGDVATEAIVTGFVAGLLSYLVGMVMKFKR
jgi:hypothetical protein